MTGAGLATVPTPATPPTPATTAEERIAELTAQVEALEVALRQRSRELRLLQARLGARDLAALSLLGSHLTAYHPDLWLETTSFTPAEVDETLSDLWSWLASQSRQAAAGPAGPSTVSAA